MTKDKVFAPVDHIAQSILLLRGQRVLLDNDLAALYGVETRRLNEQVRRNQERFPEADVRNRDHVQSSQRAVSW